MYKVSGMKKNLLSISYLTHCGNFIVSGPKDVKFCQQVKIVNTPIMEGQKVNSIYVLLAEDAYVENTKGGDTNDLWHARLGYVNYHKLKMMMSKSSLRGLPNLDVRTNVVCARC